MRRVSSLVNTAFHEAGHAVEAWYLEIPFSRVSIRPEQDSLGHLLLKKTPAYVRDDSEKYNERRARQWFESRVCVNFGGQIAETIHRGRKPVHWSHSQDDDHAIIFALQACGSGKQATKWLDWLFTRTDDHLKSNWELVEAVAGELLKQEVIRKQDVHQIIRNVILKQ